MLFCGYSNFMWHIIICLFLLISKNRELFHTKERRDNVCQYLTEALGERCISSELQLAGPEYGHLQGFSSLPPAYSEELFGPELVDKVSLHPLSQDMTTLKTPTVTVDNSLSSVHTLLQIQCVDQKSLCYDLMRISKDSDIKVFCPKLSFIHVWCVSLCASLVNHVYIKGNGSKSSKVSNSH